MLAASRSAENEDLLSVLLHQREEPPSAEDDQSSMRNSLDIAEHADELDNACLQQDSARERAEDAAIQAQLREADAVSTNGIWLSLQLSN